LERSKGMIGWSVAKALRVGATHQECQDAVDFKLGPNGALLGALADGAGSAVLGAEGAEIAVRIALASLQEGLPLKEVFETAHRAIVNRAEEAGQSPRDYACTLMVARLTETTSEFGQIGDGVIVVRTEDGWKSVLASPQLENINTTDFLTQPDWATHVLFASHSAMDELLLTSDGLSALIVRPTGEGHAPFFQRVFDGLPRDGGQHEGFSQWLHTMLGSQFVTSRSDDDTSILVAARSEAQR
jgi:hypothetical protein